MLPAEGGVKPGRCSGFPTLATGEVLCPGRHATIVNAAKLNTIQVPRVLQKPNNDCDLNTPVESGGCPIV
jgi:hypothetical protein